MKRGDPFFQAIAPIMAGLVGSIAVLALLSWGIGWQRWGAFGDNLVPMQPLTALNFVFIALALAARVRWPGQPREKAIVWAAGGLALGSSLMRIYRWSTPTPTMVDGWQRIVEAGANAVALDQIAPLTAGVFMLTVGALAGIGSPAGSVRWSRHAPTGAAVLAVVISAIVGLAYGAGTPLDYGDDAKPMALLTAVSFLLLNAGIMAAILFPPATGERGVETGSPGGSDFDLPSLWRRLVWVVLAAFVSCAAGSLLYLRWQKENVRRQVQEQLEVIASLKIRQIVEWQQERFGDARSLAATPNLVATIRQLADNPANRTRATASFRHYLGEVADAYGYRQILVLDRDLQRVLATSSDAVVEETLSSEFLVEFRHAHAPLLRDLHRTRDGRIHFDLVVPVREPDGELVGALQLMVDASAALYPLMQDWPTFTNSGETLLARRDGNHVLYLSPLRRHPDAALRLRVPLESPALLAARALRAPLPGLLEGTDYAGRPVLGVARRVAGTAWVLIAKVDEREAYGPIRDELLTVFTGLLLIAGVVGLFMRNVWQERQRMLVEQQLARERQTRAASERLAHLMQQVGEVILLFDGDMRIVEANDRVREVYGWTPAEMLPLRASDLRAAEARGDVAREFGVAMSTGLAMETVHRRKDGTTFPVEVNARPVVIDGRPHVLSIIRDVTQRRQHEREIARLSRLYFVTSQVNKTLLRVKTAEDLFASVCDVLVSVGEFRIAWVGMPDVAARTMRVVASKGDVHGYLEGIPVSIDADKPEGRGPSGAAYRAGQISVCNDFLADPATLPWRDRAQRSGIAASISLPFRTRGETVGLLTVYSGEKNFFAPREVELLEETAENISFALELFAQDALRQAVEAEHRKLSLAVEQNPASVVITDLDGKIEYVNPRFTEMTGYTLAEVRGQNPRIFKSGLTPPEVYDDLWRTIVRGDSWRGEIINRKKTGEYHVEQVIVAPVKDAAGRATHYVAIKEDVTQRKQVEVALVESEAKVRRLLAMVPLPIGHSDAQGRITFANERFYQTFGYRADEVPDVQTWWQRAYPDPQYRALIAERWSKAVARAEQADGIVPPMECLVTRKDGAVRTVEVSGMLSAGEMLITFTDISERVQADRKMRQMTRIIEQAPLSIAITDLDGAIEYVNPSFRETTGYAEAEVLGRNPRLLKSGRTPVKVYQDMWKTLRRGDVWRGELSNRKRNGDVFEERAVIAPVTDELGRVTHYVALKEDITRVKQTEAALRESNERFRAMFESNLDGLLISTPAGEILAANPAACMILGRSEAEIRRTGRSGFLAADDPRAHAIIEERQRVGRARGVLTVIRGDGSRFEAEISTAVFGVGGEQRHGVVLRDISQRLKVEEALRESEQRFRELFDLETDAIMVYSVDTGRIIQANRAAEQLYGVPMERLLAMTIEDTSAEPALTAATRQSLLLPSDQVVRIPLRHHRRSDGSVFPAEISLRSFRRGGQWLAVGVIRDITDQLRAQNQLRRFNEELEAKVVERTEQIAAANREMQALLQSIPDLVMRVTRDGTVLNFQPAKGTGLLATLPEADVTKGSAGLGEALRRLVRTVGEKALSDHAVAVLEEELPAPTGAVAIEVRAAAVSLNEFVAFVRDVTARKRLESEMAAMLQKEHQISEMKTRFISVTSHEFRTPMAAALGSVELLANHLDRLAPAKRGELMDRIRQSLNRMTEMLDEILLLNRMDANRVEVRLAPVDLHQFMRNLAEEIRLGDKVGHPIEFEVTGTTSGWETDTNLLHHIVGNLLSNAVRYSPAGTRILVRLAADANGVQIAVEDHGIGIPATDLERIFQPFERGSNVGNIKGTGLGLNIVKRMVERLRGTITVHSSKAGSCFAVCLPRLTGSKPPRP